ncbi:3'-5' exonuclease [Methanothermococcus thermolithotrophicus]|jgi:superfamily I DNA/RNA helicase|uniref:3'-5' exonuclease n=1 Tax=Methanothermococcus thermolithotrophicus TaxID=2186 RepID=UPI000475DD28|nr:3'-5' exonuclease [Methanothermococcus thermolithotrophicus]
MIEYDDIYGIRLSKLYGIKNNYHDIFDNWKVDLVKSAIVKNNDEERRLMFVAITRAKQYVFFTSHNPSEFFNGLLKNMVMVLKKLKKLK